MSENSSRIPARFIFYPMTGSAFLFVLSRVFFFEFSPTKIVSSGVLNLILDNRTLIHYRSTSTSYRSTVIPRSHIGDGIPSEGLRIPCNPSDRVVCDPGKPLLRVYMYDLPPMFHFGLLGWKGIRDQNWPNVKDRAKIPPYPGGLNLQHSIEYWLTLDLLSLEFPDSFRPCTVLRETGGKETGGRQNEECIPGKKKAAKVMGWGKKGLRTTKHRPSTRAHTYCWGIAAGWMPPNAE